MNIEFPDFVKLSDNELKMMQEALEAEAREHSNLAALLWQKSRAIQAVFDRRESIAFQQKHPGCRLSLRDALINTDEFAQFEITRGNDPFRERILYIAGFNDSHPDQIYVTIGDYPPPHRTIVALVPIELAQRMRQAYLDKEADEQS